MSPVHGSLALPDEDATLAAGARLARALHGERGPIVLALSGPLGSGKTTFARGLLRALGASGAIRSPSYTLVEEHAVTGWQVLHLDLYRLAEGDTLQEFGLRDRLEPGTLLLVEWPERAARGGLPPADAAIELGFAAAGHHLAANAATSSGSRLVEALLTAAPDVSPLSS